MRHGPALPAAIASGRRVGYPAGTTIFREGDAVSVIQVVLKGLVRLSTRSHGGEIFIGVCPPGWPLSVVPAILGRPQLVEAVAVCASDAVQFTVDEFYRLRRTDADVADWFEAMLARETSEQLSRWVDVAPKGTLAGLTWLLVQCFRAAGRVRRNGEIQLEFHLPVSTLAEWLGVTRQTASDYLAQLRADGSLDPENGWFIVPPSSPLYARILGPTAGAGR